MPLVSFRSSFGRISGKGRVTSRLCAAAFLALLLGQGPGHGQEQATGEVRPRFEFMHLWLAGIERPALEYLRDTVLSQAVEWHEHRVQGNFYGVRDALVRRLALDIPPTATFWIGGQEIAYMQEKKLFRTITPAMMAEPLSESLWPALVDALRVPDGYAALPVVIHLQNILLFNQEAFARADVSVPETWSGFLAIAPKLQAAGVVPLAISDERWQMRFLFNAILAEGLTAERYEALLDARGDEAEDLAILQRAFATLYALKPYANMDSSNLPWNKVVEKVASGNAAITITGDFVAPAVASRRALACKLAIGNNVVFWSYDVVALPEPVSPEDRLGQDMALQALTRTATLLEFGKKKGGLPVVRAAREEELDPCSANSLRNWREKEHYHFSTDRWRLQLNLLASMPHAFWTMDGPDPSFSARQLRAELRAISRRSGQ